MADNDDDGNDDDDNDTDDHDDAMMTNVLMLMTPMMLMLMTPMMLIKLYFWFAPPWSRFQQIS